MKTLTIILILITTLFFSCKKKENGIVDPSKTKSNLITNSSFETDDNQKNYDGWKGTVYILDSLGYHSPLINDAPTGGGLWCLHLTPQWYPVEGFSETSITGQTGTNIYQLTVWMKSSSSGLFSLEQWRTGQRINFKRMLDTASIWKELSFRDTLTLLPTDTLKVHLSAGASEVFSRWVNFDLVKLEKIN